MKKMALFTVIQGRYQVVIIHGDGRVKFTEVAPGAGMTGRNVIPAPIAKNLMAFIKAVAAQNAEEKPIPEGVDSWHLTIYNPKHEKQGCQGYLAAKGPLGDAAQNLRQALNLPDAWLFDGRQQIEPAEKLTLTLTDSQAAGQPGLPYQETVTVSAKQRQLFVTVQKAEKTPALQASFSLPDQFWQNLTQVPATDFLTAAPAEKMAAGQQLFQLQVVSASFTRSIMGVYARASLPQAWLDLLPALRKSLRILHAPTFGLPGKAASDQPLLVKVAFPNGNQWYTYLSSDASLTVGQFLRVPVGENGQQAPATIKEIRTLFDNEAVASLSHRYKWINNEGA